MIYFRIQKLSLKYLLLTELRGELMAEREEGQDGADAVPAIGGTDDVLHAGEDLLRASPVLARIPGSSNFRDTLGSSFHSAVGTLWVLVGRSQADQGQHEEGGDETHLELVLEFAEDSPHVLCV